MSELPFPERTDFSFLLRMRAPPTSYAATAPFERIYTEGYLYRKAIEHPHGLIVVVGVWLLFGGLALTTFVFGIVTGPPDMAIAAAFFPISIIVIWRTTRRYLKQRAEKQDSGQRADVVV